MANNIPPLWWAQRRLVRVVAWARSCKDQAIHVEVMVMFTKEVAIQLVQRVLTFLAKGSVTTMAVTMANFHFNSHIKVINGSVVKTFLKVGGLTEEEWEEEEVMGSVRVGLEGVLQEAFQARFAASEEELGTVDWSFNLTYRPETFKSEVLEVVRSHACLYTLVSPGPGTLGRVTGGLAAAVGRCREQQAWWDPDTNSSKEVTGCRTSLPGLVFTLVESFVMTEMVQVRPGWNPWITSLVFSETQQNSSWVF